MWKKFNKILNKFRSFVNKLKKTKEKESLTFDDFDKLNLKSAGENLFQIIENRTRSSIEEGSYTISLNAKFGNGKTTFLKMFESFVKNKNNYKVLFIDAWRSDFHGEPIIAILSEIANHVTEGRCIKKNIIGIIGKFATLCAEYKTGINFSKLMKCYNKIGKNFLQEFNQRKKIIKEIKKVIPKYTENKKLLIIVDELDRTRPDYAVHFLEDMKHFFDIENVVFLIAVNKEQMKETVKTLYGQNLDFDGYYSKFFKQEIDLPDPYKEAEKFVDSLIEKTNVKFREDHRTYRVKSVYSSCKIFNLTLRDVENFVRVFELILGSKDNRKGWLYQDCYAFFICLYLKDKKFFNKIIEGEIGVKDFLGNYGFQAEEYLIAHVAISFTKDRKYRGDFNLISEKFTFVNGNHLFYFSSENGTFDGMYRLNKIQPAFDICKNIKQCKSEFL